MKLKLILLTILFGFSNLGISQEIDTLKLKKEVEELSDISSVKKYLKRILDEDQKYRGREANHALDFKHLISISYFVNKFGYPTKDEFGDLSNTAWLVWKHCNIKKIDRISFPIINKGFLIGDINENDLRTYHVYPLYAEKYDDEKYRSMPLSKLFELCEVNTTPNISIETILQIKKEVDLFDELEIVSTSTWKSDDTSKTYDLNGSPFVQTFSGEEFELIEKINGKKYLLRSTIDNSGRPIEIIKIDHNKYKYKNQKTKKYFEFIANTMIFRTENKVLKEYKNTSDSKVQNGK